MDWVLPMLTVGRFSESQSSTILDIPVLPPLWSPGHQSCLGPPGSTQQQAEQSRAEQSRAEQSRAEQSRGEKGEASPWRKLRKREQRESRGCPRSLSGFLENGSGSKRFYQCKYVNRYSFFMFFKKIIYVFI